MTIEIDYKFCAFTDRVAFVIKTWNEQGRMISYSSPFMFADTEDAYLAACVELSGK